VASPLDLRGVGKLRGAARPVRGVTVSLPAVLPGYNAPRSAQSPRSSSASSRCGGCARIRCGS